jgi:hypothetical protein
LFAPVGLKAQTEYWRQIKVMVPMELAMLLKAR